MTTDPSRQAYSSTVTSRAHLLVGLGITAATAAFMVAVGAPPVITVVVVVVLIATSVFVSTVRVVIGADRITLGQGPLAWPRRDIPLRVVTQAAAEDLTSSQAYGADVGWTWRTTRLTIRRGPTLALTLASGEVIRVSTADPDRAASLIDALRAPVDHVPGPSAPAGPAPLEDHRPWFGPKRTGYGIRPQTWQGWLLTSGTVLLVILVAYALRH